MSFSQERYVGAVMQYVVNSIDHLREYKRELANSLEDSREELKSMQELAEHDDEDYSEELSKIADEIHKDEAIITQLTAIIWLYEDKLQVHFNRASLLDMMTRLSVNNDEINKH